MTTTIALSQNSHKELTMIKINEGFRNMDDVVHKLIIEHKKLRFIKSSEKIKSRMKDLDLSLMDLIG